MDPIYTPEEQEILDSINADDIDLEDLSDVQVTQGEQNTQVDIEDNNVTEGQVEQPTTVTTEEDSAAATQEDEVPDYYEDLDWNKLNPDVEAFTVKVNGTDMKLTLREMQTLASKGMDYTKKTQQLAKQRGIVDAIERYKISEEDIALLTDIKAGKKEAIGTVLKNAKIDPLDLNLDEIQPYVPPKVVLADNQIALNEVAEQLKSSPVYGKITDLVSNEWSDGSLKIIEQQPQILLDIEKDLTPMGEGKPSMYDLVKPIYEKRLVLAKSIGNTQPNLEVYAHARREYLANVNNTGRQLQEAKEITAKRDIRKAASLPASKSVASTPSSILKIGQKEIKSAYDISDKELDDWAKEQGILLD
jgi:hypothetical protein